MKETWKMLRKKAVNLRKKGLSYNEIKKRVPVAKSTLSVWLKTVPLSDTHKKRLYTKQIYVLSRGTQSQKERRKREVDEIIRNAVREVRIPLSDETHKLFGAALYWAEGNKTKNFEITNSDPSLIAFIVTWFEAALDVDTKILKARLNIYSQQDDVKIKKFWSELTGIPLENFGKSYIKPESTGFKKNNLYYGTIKIYVPKGTDLRHRVFGWIKAILQNTDNTVESVQRKWESLRETPRPVNLSTHP